MLALQARRPLLQISLGELLCLVLLTCTGVFYFVSRYVPPLRFDNIAPIAALAIAGGSLAANTIGTACANLLRARHARRWLLLCLPLFGAWAVLGSSSGYFQEWLM